MALKASRQPSGYWLSPIVITWASEGTSAAVWLSPDPELLISPAPAATVMAASLWGAGPKSPAATIAINTTRRINLQLDRRIIAEAKFGCAQEAVQPGVSYSYRTYSRRVDADGGQKPECPIVAPVRQGRSASS